MAGAAAISAGGSVLSGALGFMGAGKAASAQQAAAQLMASTMKEIYETTRRDLAPYRDAGANALPILQRLTGTAQGTDPATAMLTQAFTGADLANTPGYQFQMDQGLQAVNNKFASQGLAKSGALGKGLAAYAEGLAGTRFDTSFAQDLANKKQIFDMLFGQVGLGESAAAQTGALGTQQSNSILQAIASGGNAQAAGIMGQTNALTGAIGGAAGGFSSMLALQSLLNPNGGNPTSMYPLSTSAGTRSMIDWSNLFANGGGGVPIPIVPSGGVVGLPGGNGGVY